MYLVVLYYMSYHGPLVYCCISFVLPVAKVKLSKELSVVKVITQHLCDRMISECVAECWRVKHKGLDVFDLPP